jgi:hypothetical protein
MALIDQMPTDIPTSNALDAIPDDLLGGPPPPAYYAFSQSPGAMENPLADGDTATLCMRVKCVGEHGPITRKDGEKRYKRDLAVQAVWRLGDPEPPEPPDPDADQPALFGDESGEDADE